MPGAEPAALISARGTSVWARRSIMLGAPVATGVRQTGISKGAATSTAVAPARVMMFPASKVANAVTPSAAVAVAASSFCDCVNVAMCQLQNQAEEKICQIRDATGRTVPGIQRRPLSAYFAAFPGFPQASCGVRTPAGETRHSCRSDVRFISEAEIRANLQHVCFVPEVCARGEVARSFKYLVSASEYCRWHNDAKRLRGF